MEQSQLTTIGEYRILDRIGRGAMGEVFRAQDLGHAHGFVHRDLKPANIHVKSDGCAKIMDFGLVRLEASNMTRTGMVMGSPSYMAPELIRGMKADARSDVFALGSVFYELLAGRRAFPGKAMADVLMAVMKNDPEPLSRRSPEVPAAVAHIVERCLKKDADARYQTAGELSAATEVAAIVYLEQYPPGDALGDDDAAS